MKPSPAFQVRIIRARDERAGKFYWTFRTRKIWGFVNSLTSEECRAERLAAHFCFELNSREEAKCAGSNNS